MLSVYTHFMYKAILLVGVLMLLGCYKESKAFDSINPKNMNIRENMVMFMPIEEMYPDSNVRALAEASGNGRLNEMEALVRGGVDVNARGKGNATPLFWAMNNIAGFERLLELGADPNAVFDDGSSVMHWVVIHKDSRFLVSALDHGGNPDLVAGQFKETPIFKIMGPDDKDKIDLLLDAGANIDFQATTGNTPMMVAAGLGQFDTVFKLLNRGADYTIKRVNGDDLAGVIRDRRKTMDPDNDLTRWMEKVIEWLNERGVNI